MLCCVYVCVGFDGVPKIAKVGFKVLLDWQVEVTKRHCRLNLSRYFLSIEQDYLQQNIYVRE